MDDTAALYLSHVLAIHHAPDQLLTRVPPAKAGLPQQQLAAYDATKCQGIVYLPNTSLRGAGLKVLDLAEKERRKRADAILSHGSTDDLHRPGKYTETPRHSSGSSHLSSVNTAATHRRRVSGSASVDISTAGATVNAMSDLNRARSRIEGDELEQAGQLGNDLLCNDLWRIAFKMLCLAREIRPLVTKDPAETKKDPTEANMHPSNAKKDPPQAEMALPPPKAKTDSLQVEDFPLLPPPPPPTPPKSKGHIVKTLEIPGFNSKVMKPLTPLSTPLGAGNPNQAMPHRSTHTRKASKEITHTRRTSLTVPPTPTLTPPTPLLQTTATRLANAVTHAESKPYRSLLPCGFSEEAWWRILGHATGAGGILSERQQKGVLRWGMDRSTLRRGREWLVEREGNQIWHVLEGMGCLAYEFEGGDA